MPGFAPVEITRFLTAHMYHPRSSSHGDAMCSYLLRDLYNNCPALKAMADNGSLVYQTNYTINKDTPSRWTIDLVLGRATNESLSATTTVAKADPSEIWIAIDAKAIMTEHGKARRNRQRDLNSMADILHRMSPTPIIGAYLIMNMASQFRSPLRDEVTKHKNIEQLVAGTIPLFDDILKNEETGRPGLDAMGVTIVDYSNLLGSECKLVNGPPAPKANDPLHYQNFLSKICTKFSARHGSL